jgi:hypothetical protein
MDAYVHLCDVDPTGANAVHFGLARRGNGGDGREFAETILEIREIRGESDAQGPRVLIFSGSANQDARRMAPAHKEA